MNKFLSIIIIFFSLISNTIANPSIQARTGILMDYHSGEILFELDPDAQIYPASMTKIMTSIVAFDLIKKKVISNDDKVLVIHTGGLQGIKGMNRYLKKNNFDLIL